MEATKARRPVSRDERPAKDVEILRRWSEPNFARINSLVKQGFDKEAAAEYDVLERREAALLDLDAERGLGETEEEELARIGQELAEMHRQATCEHEETETQWREADGPVHYKEPADADQVLVCTECGKEWTDPDQARKDGALNRALEHQSL